MREAGPGPAAEAAKYEERKQTVLENVKQLEGFAEKELLDMRWSPRKTPEGAVVNGVDIPGFFELKTGRLMAVGSKPEKVPANWAEARLFLGAPADKRGQFEHVRVAEWGVPKSVFERNPEAMAALGASFAAFEQQSRKKTERQIRGLAA